jgi:hypothetical protein
MGRVSCGVGAVLVSRFPRPGVDWSSARRAMLFWSDVDSGARAWSTSGLVAMARDSATACDLASFFLSSAGFIEASLESVEFHEISSPHLEVPVPGTVLR